MEPAKWEIVAYTSVILLFTGLFLFVTFLFWNIFLMLLGASLLIASIIGLALYRKKWSTIKRTNPEIVEAMKAEFKERVEKEKTLSIKDIPPLLIAILLVALVISFLGEVGAFRFSPILDFLLGILTILLLIYYFIGKRRVKKEKYPQTQVVLTSS